MKGGQILKGRPCRIDIATSRGRDDRSPAPGNWREGTHQVVDQSESGRNLSASHATRGPLSAPPPMANWRETARPVENIERSSPGADLAGRFPGRRESPSLASGGLASRGPTATSRGPPQLKLTPRTKPMAAEDEQLATDQYSKSNKPNPFGAAKPREIVLAHKRSEGGDQDEK